MFTSKKPNSVKNYVLCCLSQKMFELVKNKKNCSDYFEKVIFYKKKSKKKRWYCTVTTIGICNEQCRSDFF